jgi:hypothetical protein
MIGRQHGHHRLGIAAINKTNPESDGRRSVPLGRFSDNVFGRQHRANGAHGGFLLAVGQNENTLGRNGIAKPDNRLLEHGALGEKLEKLLGAGATAVGPKAFPTAAGKNQDIKVGLHVAYVTILPGEAQSRTGEKIEDG